MFTEPSKSLDIHINKPILSKLNLLVIKGEFDKGLLTLKLKKRKPLQAKMWSSTTWLSTPVLKVPIPPVPSPLKAPTRM
jgi:hypothetical protein